METFERTNTAIAWLAYPDCENKRRGLESRLNYDTRATLSTADDAADRSDIEPAENARVAPSFQPNAISSRVRNRLDNRMRVARMFRPFLRRSLADLPKGLERYSINALSRYVAQDDKDLAQNFEKRWFKTTLPVLHLAIAFDLISTLHFDDERKIVFSVHEADFIETVLWTSVALERFVTSNSFYRVDPARLVRLRPE